MSTLVEDYQSRQQAIAENDKKRQQDMDQQVAELTSTVNSSFSQLMQQFNELRDKAMNSDSERQSKLMGELESFVELQKTQLNSTLEKASSVNDQFAQTVQNRMDALTAQDKERDTQIRTQMGEMQSTAAFLIEDMRKAMDSHIQSVNAVVQQAAALNDGVQRNQAGLNKVADSVITASQHMEQTSANLQRGHQEVARATDGLSGTLSLATSAVTKTSQQNSSVAEGLQGTLSGLEALKSSIQEISNDIRKGAENADNASRELSSNHARYRQEMQDTIGSLHEQLGILLNNYAKQVQDQTSHRMEEWNRHTQDYVSGMRGVVNVMQELVDDMENRRAA